MVTCPICGAGVNADFGMVSCAACESVFMIEIDGTVTLPSAETTHETDIAEEAAAAVDSVAGDDILAEPPAFETEAPADFSGDEITQDEPGEYVSPTDDAAFAAPEDEESLETAASEEVAAEPEGGADYSEDFLDSMDNAGAPVVENDPNDPLGVSKFDGAEASQLADGPYYYDLRVSGVDTASLKQQVMDALSDRRLGWSSEEIKKKLKMGQLVLENLNPVRAVLAVLRLQSLDVDVEWDQKLYTADTDPAKDQET